MVVLVNKYYLSVTKSIKLNIMTNEQKLQSEFEAFFTQSNQDAKEIVSRSSLNTQAVTELKKATSKAKEYTIEDVTPEGYGI